MSVEDYADERPITLEDDAIIVDFSAVPLNSSPVILPTACYAVGGIRKSSSKIRKFETCCPNPKNAGLRFASVSRFKYQISTVTYPPLGGTPLKTRQLSR